MSQQSPGIKATYMEQKRYFLGLTFTVWQKPQQRQNEYFSNSVTYGEGRRSPIV